MPQHDANNKQIWQRHIVRQWKSLETATSIRELLLRDESHRVVGKLVPVDVDRAGSPELIERFTQWREQNMSSFLTQFKATPERTALWLQRYLLDDSRLLFLIVEGGRPIGHVGLCGLQATTAEGDGLLRGEKSRSPFIVFFAEAWLLRWAFLTFGLQTITSRCLSTNRRVLSLVRMLGFEETRLERLRRDERGDEITFVPDGALSEEGGADDEMSLVSLELTRESLFLTHPWLAPPPEARSA